MFPCQHVLALTHVYLYDTVKTIHPPSHDISEYITLNWPIRKYTAGLHANQLSGDMTPTLPSVHTYQLSEGGTMTCSSGNVQ